MESPHTHILVEIGAWWTNFPKMRFATNCDRGARTEESGESRCAMDENTYSCRVACTAATMYSHAAALDYMVRRYFCDAYIQVQSPASYFWRAVQRRCTPTITLTVLGHSPASLSGCLAALASFRSSGVRSLILVPAAIQSGQR